MLRRMVQIDEALCNGCGACAQACHEQAIVMRNGKATLLRDDYCDGLGDCLPSCPTGAISFVEREALPYDQAAVNAHIGAKQAPACADGSVAHTGCPGSRVTTMAPCADTDSDSPSALRQWPVQLQLVPINAPYFENADVLVAADCTAYAYGDFHRDFLQGRVLLVACPKLDAQNATPHLTELFTRRNIRSVTVLRMEVPCCGGLQRSVEQALAISGKDIPCTVTTLTLNGQIKG